ncbi:MAG TPA: DUF302 domain-containing protein [Anaerolineae bacterium]
MGETTATKLGTTVQLKLDFDAAIAATVEALKAQGFGVLTEIDVKETVKKKLGLDFRPYRILGACNPALSHKALTIAPEIGLLLPCNVVVDQIADGMTQVSLVDPLGMMSMVEHAGLEAVANEAAERLSRVAAALAA